MKRFDYRILVGAALILGGILLLLEKLGFLPGAMGYFWAGLLAIVAVFFLFWFFSDRSKWWAAIPGFTLAGLAAAILLPGKWNLNGLAVLGGIGVAFWAVYLRSRSQWWAIIPGGILLTLGGISTLSANFKAEQIGGVFFGGLGLTFLLVAILANQKWAYIPAAVLLLFGLLVGFLLGTPFVGIMDFAWIGILLIAGIVMVIGSLRHK